MAVERYPGEGRGLRLFLEELLPVVARDGRHPMLLHAIRRALESGELAHLRHARQLFNHLPRPERQALSTALLGPRRPHGPGAEPAPPAPERAETALAVRFETPREADSQRPLHVELCHEEAAAAPINVTIRAGTLPSVAIDALRRIAAMLEADRRLLSSRFWLSEGSPARDEQRDVVR
jgi:hypothetical protein